MSEAYAESYRPPLNPGLVRRQQKMLRTREIEKDASARDEAHRKIQAWKEARTRARELAKAKADTKRQKAIERVEGWAATRNRQRRADRRFNRLIREMEKDAPRLENADDPRGVPSMREIIETVAMANGMTRDDIIGPGRNKAVVTVRQEAMAEVYLTHRHHKGLPQIGRAFQRDHTTILHALRKKGVYVEIRKGQGTDESSIT